MKPLNCDQVFEVLTRGPFPTGEAIDRPVERHLASCHECRELAEALRPAVELFHEAVSPEESRDLPGYHGPFATSSGGLAQMVAEAISSDQPRRESAALPLSRTRLWRRLRTYRPTQTEAFLAALAVGALFVLSLAGFGAFDGGAPAALAQRPPQHEGLLHLASLELRHECFAWSADKPQAMLQCCTECHVARTERHLSKPAIAVVAASCRSCHQ